MKRTSIKDIAQAVGVSTATVSLVLTGKGKNGRVSQEMSEKIRQKAKELNYQPNRLAQSLQSGRTHTVGLLVTDIVNPFFATLAYHIQQEMGKIGYAVIIANTNEENGQMKKMVELLQSRQVDGFIIIPTEAGEDCVKQLVENRVPLVLIDRYYPEIATNNVLIDNFDASYQATKYLIDKGCKDIALFIYGTQQPHMEGRKKGYVEALEEAGLFNDKLIREVKYKTLIEDIEKEMLFLFDGDKQADGILFASNTIGLSGLKQLMKLSVNIPEDIQVVCFDKSDVFDFLPTAIPYVLQPIQSIARMASRLLLEQLEESETNTSSYRLPAELIVS